MTSKLLLHRFVDQAKTTSFPFSTTLLRSLTEVFNCRAVVVVVLYYSIGVPLCIIGCFRQRLIKFKLKIGEYSQFS